MNQVGPNKAIAGGMAGAVVTLAVFIFSQFGVQIPAEVATALTGLLGTVAVWFVPHGGQ